MEVQCSICLEPIHLRVEGDTDPEPVQVATNCGHIFHRYCLRFARKQSSWCPNCNKEPISFFQIYPAYAEVEGHHASQIREVRKLKEVMNMMGERHQEEIENLRKLNLKLESRAEGWKAKWEDEVVDNLTAGKLKKLKQEMWRFRNESDKQMVELKAKLKKLENRPENRTARSSDPNSTEAQFSFNEVIRMCSVFLFFIVFINIFLLL